MFAGIEMLKFIDIEAVDARHCVSVGMAAAHSRRQAVNTSNDANTRNTVRQ
jgi:hypothetical protein